MGLWHLRLRQYEEMIDAEDAEHWDGRGDLMLVRDSDDKGASGFL